MKRSKKATAKIKKHSFTRMYAYLALVVVLASVAVAALAVSTPKKVREAYYAHKVKSSLSSETEKLGNPLKELGFTDIKEQTNCSYYPKMGYQGRPLSCTTQQQSYVVFNSDSAKNKANAAAANLSKLMSQNGWHQDDPSIADWFKGVTNKVDYYPDDYNYKYSDNTFCVLDFFEAYSNPKPPAASVVFTCTTPEIHTPYPSPHDL
jgi:hypothetical protein